MKEEANMPLGFIEGFLKSGVALTAVKRVFGEPYNIMNVKQIKETMYEYNNKNNELVEWIFGVNDQGDVVWFGHEPWLNPLLDRVETLPTTLKKYNCKRKRKPDASVATSRHSGYCACVWEPLRKRQYAWRSLEVIAYKTKDSDDRLFLGCGFPWSEPPFSN